MKKRIISCLLAVILTVSLSACGFNSLQKDYEYSSQSLEEFEAAQSENTAKAKIPAVDNTTPYDQLITKKLDIHSFIQTYCVNNDNLVGSGRLADIAADYTIECLRETEAGSLYSIHRVKQGGLLYLFYSDKAETAYEERRIVNWYYLQKQLSYQDFDSIEEGSTIDDVKAIDPATQVFENMFQLQLKDPLLLGAVSCSMHYLDDGVLMIYYKIENGKFVVTQKIKQEYIMEYGIVSSSGPQSTYNFKLLPIDWPTDELK